MFDIIKKSILAGVGAIVVTEEKIQDIVDDFVQKGKLTEEEGKSLIDELQKTLQENKTKLTATIDERIKCIMRDLNLITKDDLTEMEKSIKKDLATVKRRLTQIEKQMKIVQEDTKD
jgi:polyhydroxyalkanoate synthesis regulator phasin